MTPRLPRVLARVWRLVSAGRVLFTLKARQEFARLNLDEWDACDVLIALGSGDFAGRIKSELTGEWMYLFKPQVAGAVVYVKLILRSDCVVVSFHEDDEEDDEGDQGYDA